MKKEYFCLNCGKELHQGHSSTHKFCDNTCQLAYQHKQYIEKWKKGEVTGIAGEYGISKHIRLYLMDKNDYKCELCGWGVQNPYTGRYPLEVHHKDGNYQHNKEENLQLLCPNCHSLTETFKNHNKTGRKSRSKYN